MRSGRPAPVLLVALVLLVTTPAGSEPASGPGDVAGMVFVPNAGQAHSELRWLGHASGASLGVTADALNLRLPAAAGTVALRFDRPRTPVRYEGLDPLPGTVNYLVGDDPDGWATGLGTYAGLALRGLYDGVDLLLEGSATTLKGTFLLEPGVDPARIRWTYIGIDDVLSLPGGDLLLPFGDHELRETAPVAWQVRAGTTVPVAASYRRHADGSFGFRIAGHDPGLPLVIDPYLELATLAGGSDADEGRDVAVHDDGTIYVTGSTRSPDFPGAGPPQPGYGGPSDPSNLGDAFVMKLGPDGRTVLSMTYLGGAGQDVGDAIALAPDGGIVIAGTTESTDLPTVSPVQAAQGGQDCSSPPCNDLFVAKLRPSGDVLEFATYLGGSRDESPALVDFGTRQHTVGLDVDSAGAIYVLGTSNSPDFPTVGAFQPTLAGLDDLVLVTLAGDGRSILYSTYLGGSGAEYSGGVAVDASGVARVAGGTLSSDFPTRSALDPDKNPLADAVVAALDTRRTGPSSLVSSTYLGGSGAEQAFGIGVDSAGNTHVAGWTGSTDLPLANAFQTVNASADEPQPRDGFLAVLSADGRSLLYGTYFGGTGYDVVYDLALGPDGTTTLAGPTRSDDLPLRLPFQSGRRDGIDLLVATFDTRRSGGASLVSSTYLGGDDSENAYGVAVGGDGGVVVTGVTGGTVSDTFPVDATLGPNGTTDGVLVARLRPGVRSWLLVGSRANGANDSIWRTDLGLRNTDDAAALVEVLFHRTDGVRSATWTVPAGAQVIVADVVGSLGASGSGAIEVVADRDVKVSSRTFNLVAGDQSCYPGGTLGQGFGAVLPGDLLADGDRAWIPQLVENPGYRTNLALTNTGLAPASVRVTLHDGDGRQLASYTVDLDPGEWKQENRPFFTRGGRNDLAAGYAVVTVTAGAGVVATGSVVDNVTNDPTTVPMVPADGAGATRSWVLVASRADGANGSIWRTDLGLLNVDTSDAEATIRIHTPGGVLTTTVQVPGRGQVILDDVVGRFPFDGSGALEILSDRPLVVTSRIFNRVAAGQACFPGGTLGQENAGYPAGSGLGSGDAAWLVQLIENDEFRTNIALTNTGDDPASVAVRLFDAAGAEIGGYQVTLAPGQWRQENRPFARRAGRADVDAGSASVTVESGGGVLAVGSVVDNVTNDPTTVVWIR